jgi:hypothetical protein
MPPDPPSLHMVLRARISPSTKNPVLIPVSILRFRLPTFLVSLLISLFCRLKRAYQAIQKEYETRLAVEHTKAKKLQLKIKNLQEDLILVVCVCDLIIYCM